MVKKYTLMVHTDKLGKTMHIYTDPDLSAPDSAMKTVNRFLESAVALRS